MSHCSCDDVDDDQVSGKQVEVWAQEEGRVHLQCSCSWHKLVGQGHRLGSTIWPERGLGSHCSGRMEDIYKQTHAQTLAHCVRLCFQAEAPSIEQPRRTRR